jgi:hypothetical protein
MKTTKTLALAALAALSLSVGTAMAQDGGGGFFLPDRQVTAPAPVINLGVSPIPSGSSDVEWQLNGPGHNLTAPEILNNHLYGAGGVAG